MELEKNDDFSVVELDIRCTEAQKLAITEPSLPNSLINIVAGPGTGKTKTLCDRVAYLLGSGLKPNEIVIFSLTNQSVNDLKNILKETIGEELASLICITTFHSFAYSIAMSDSPFWQMLTESKLLGTDVISHVLNSISINSRGKHKVSVRNDEFKLVDKLSPRAISALKVTDSKLYVRYLSSPSATGALLKNENFLYDKLIHEMTQLLSLHNRGLIEIETNGLLKVNEIKEIIVDEFQDVSYVVMDFILELAKDKQLTIAGDIDQSLYGYSGATPDANINRTVPMYKQEGFHLKEIVLDRTFRFTDSIHKLGLNILNTGHSLIQETVSEENINVVREEFSNTYEEFEFIYKEIKFLIENSEGNIRPKHIAVLSGTNDSLDELKMYLDNKNGPFKCRRLTGTSLWTNSKISTIITLLKLLENPYNDASFLVCLSLLPKFGPKTIIDIKDGTKNGKHVYDVLKDTPRLLKILPSDFFVNFDKVVENTDKSDPSSIIYNLTELCKLFNFPKKLEDNWLVILSNFLEDLFARLKVISNTSGENTNILQQYISNYQNEVYNCERNTSATTCEAISLSTIHSAKGLQWDIVFILTTNCYNKQGIQAVDSRTQYVGITRAKHLLYYNKSKFDNFKYIDTKVDKVVEQSFVKVKYGKTIADYIPELKAYCKTNHLNIMPVFTKSFNKSENSKVLMELIGNMKKRAAFHVSYPQIPKMITRLGKLVSK
ncbi:uncharacterized protein C5L36_0A00620 [Pichia kudriavzevii]|uniref:DNA 3'-5' helicase n=1 Tax=Pichia kudriavzevii TaxID=4909 RepID=A0A2U9QWR8_PICKU|nr:uncharacterized protein C5L36_0A00620 [Pichia kudriavzevii]AWU73450.1 hypothetical protein C5L36_0A00620 [Pichia kudriavzevii]